MDWRKGFGYFLLPVVLEDLLGLCIVNAYVSHVYNTVGLIAMLYILGIVF